MLDGLPGTARLSTPTVTSMPFSLVGFELPDGDTVDFRTSPDGRTWAPWSLARRLSTHGEGPDARTRESTARWQRMTQPVWVGEARWLQVRGVRPDRVRAHLVDSAGLSRPGLVRAAQAGFEALLGEAAAAEAAPFQPSIVTRADWGANESWRNGEPHYADSARLAVIHHTATGNEYRREDVPAILRGIDHYHTQTLGWDDIGYNFIVDRFGRVFEGRAGGIHMPVIGAHAAGHNDGSIGVAALGCHDSDACTDGAAGSTLLAGLDGLVAWKFGYHGIDPLGTTRQGSTTLPTIVGHRDVGSTVCPGDRLYAHVRGGDPMAERVWERVHGFRDVPASSPFARDIAWVAAAGITRGCNPPANDRFCPKDLVTREQMAAFLTRALGLTNDNHPGFTDVPRNSPFHQDIRRIARAGITRGCNPPANDRFCPKDPVTREQMAAFLTRALGLTNDNHPGFTDVPRNSPFHQDIRRIARAGITRGCNPPANDRFCPKDPVTREQMAAFLRRALA